LRSWIVSSGSQGRACIALPGERIGAADHLPGAIKIEIDGRGLARRIDLVQQPAKTAKPGELSDGILESKEFVAVITVRQAIAVRVVDFRDAILRVAHEGDALFR